MPLATLYYQYDLNGQNGRLMAKIQDSPSAPENFSRHTLAENVQLSQAFVYRLEMLRNDQGMAEVTIAINGTPAARFPLDTTRENQRFYFKAGVYLNSRSENSKDGALVRFYRLAISHPAAGLHISQLSTLPEARI